MSPQGEMLRARAFARTAPGRPALAELVDVLAMRLAGSLACEWIEAARCHDYTATTMRRLLLAPAPPPRLALRDHDGGLRIEIYLAPRGRWRFVLDIEGPIERFHPSESAAALRSLLLDVGRAVSIDGAWAHSSADLELGPDPTRALETGRVEQICWFNYYGPSLADRVGRERLRSLPAARIDALPDGSVAFATAASPGTFASVADRRAQVDALAHLNPDTDRGAALAALAERSRALAPVSVSGDPDLAEILEHVLGCEPLPRRARKAAELERYRPPAVTEFEPLVAGWGEPDTDQREELDTYAETLFALLHREVPELGEDSAAALPLLDIYFWRTGAVHRRARSWVDGVLVSCIGAYVGGLIVDQLGGRWIAGGGVQETRIAVGERAWQPFARAHRFVKNHRSAIDYSMTKFYREVERHASC